MNKLNQKLTDELSLIYNEYEALKRTVTGLYPLVQSSSLVDKDEKDNETNMERDEL